MSVIVAIKQNGRVYMGADTQTSTGPLKTNILIESGYKIHKCNNGLLVGSVGRKVVAAKLIYSNAVFSVPENGGLTKKYVVAQIIPKLFDYLDGHGLLEEKDDEPCCMPCEIVLAYKDKIFKIGERFGVTEIAGFISLGAGEEYAFPYLQNFDYGKDVNEQLLKAMKCSAKYEESISAPYLFIDTQNLEFTVRED